MIVITMISFPLFLFSYSDDSSIESSLPYCYIFNILWCQCCPGHCLIGRVVGDGVWAQAPTSVTITKFWFLLVNHLILWSIFITVRLMNWKQGWIHGQGWMWFQWSMEHSLRHFTWRCVSFSLLLGTPSSEIMWLGVVLLCWYVFVFVPNWEFIEFLQTQSYDLAQVLDFNGEYSCWIGFYGPRITSRYLTRSKLMLPQIWSWWHPW